jgi:hypothetical protein
MYIIQEIVLFFVHGSIAKDKVLPRTGLEGPEGE